jgi:hypothetical protein
MIMAINHQLSNGALKALKAKGFETYKGYCSRWAREVTEFVYGDLRYNRLWRPDDKPTATKAAYAFQKAGFQVPKTDLQIGDILFKTTGAHGHVGIVVPHKGGLGVAENSTYHWNRSGGKDARGIRTLSEYGTFQIAIRLPAPEVKAEVKPQPKSVVEEQDKLILNGLPPMDMIFHNGEVYSPTRKMLELGGEEIKEWNNQLAEKHRFYINTKKAEKVA